METVMTGILDESEDISSDLLRPLLDSVRKENQVSFFAFSFYFPFINL
jgi:hypothetical protein